MILCFQLCGNSLGKALFMFQYDNAPMHKSRSIQKWLFEIVVEELDWPAQSPDLNPIEHLWDELECQLGARPNHFPTSLMLLWLLSQQFPTSSAKPPQKSSREGGPTPY